jgi:sigma-E factor negative regulatory protein RseC
MLNSGGSQSIYHRGIVQNTGNNSVLVVITSESACSGCHARGACGMSGREYKEIEIPGSYSVKKGDEVTVRLNLSSGYAAVILAYVVPLVILLVSLIVLNILNVTELMAGLLSMAMLVPYFAILFLLRHRVSQRFIFTIND